MILCHCVSTDCRNCPYGNTGTVNAGLNTPNRTDRTYKTDKTDKDEVNYENLRKTAILD